eukprot:2735629-Rhodomonas_salina.3
MSAVLLPDGSYWARGKGVISQRMASLVLLYPYAPARKCPILTCYIAEGVSEQLAIVYIDWRIMLRVRYGMSGGTEWLYQVCKHHEELAEPANVAMALDYALEMRAVQVYSPRVLCPCYGISGTHVQYYLCYAVASPSPVLTHRVGRRVFAGGPYAQDHRAGTSLRACYAVSGTSQY